jgi:predicted O-methyltransferase YrrM
VNVRGLLKKPVNQALGWFGLKLISARIEKIELDRLQRLPSGHFERPVFPVSGPFKQCFPEAILKVIHAQRELWRMPTQGLRNGFTIENDYFSSPDAETLTAVVQLYKPKKILEIGSGNSTRLFRTALKELKLEAKIVSIDPNPRLEIEAFADEIIRLPLEGAKVEGKSEKLEAGDILFIDSSHEIRTGNDVVELLLNILPRLKPGVLIHIHDIFLPFEYPKEWVIKNRWPWNEQYLVQALLQGSSEFEVLWPGHYLQRTMADFASYFPFWQRRNASSLWLKKN